MLPPPQEQAHSFARQGSDSGLECRALGTLLLIVGPCPAGVPHGFRGPFHAGLAPEWRALPAPMAPGFSAATVRHRREARLLLAFSRGGVPCTRCAASDAEAGSKDGASPRQGGTPGEVGRLLGAVCHGLGAVCKGMQEGPELSDERLDSERMRGDHARIGRPRRRALAGVEACSNHVGRAPMRGVEATLQRSAARQRRGCEGGPVGEQVPEERGGFVVNPCQAVWDGGLQRPGEALGAALWGARGGRLSRGFSTSASCRAAAVGASCAWLGVKVSRYVARGPGWTGTRTRKAY